VAGLQWAGDSGRLPVVIEGIAQLHRPARPTCYTPDVEVTFLGGAVPVPEGAVFVLRETPADSP